MRAETRGRDPKYSWPKALLRKWLKIRTMSAEFRSIHDRGGWSFETTSRMKSCSDEDVSADSIPRRSCPDNTSSESLFDLPASGWVVESSEDLKPPRFDDDEPPPLPPSSQSLRMFVATWNVGGRPPLGDLNIREWLLSSPSPVDIYVIGFQEIVPLNAGNVIGPKDKGPADRWLSMIRKALNPRKRGRVSSSPSWSNHGAMESPRSNVVEPAPPDGCAIGYHLVASKQMVGIFLCVWVRASLLPHVRAIRMSCVGRGIMGRMGNKGSISISLCIQSSTLCFVCTHLSSGDKDGDEVRRNSDVTEILKRTRFPRPQRFDPTRHSPETILGHDQIIWLGDLNYRLTASCSDADQLLRKNDWQSLLEKDQLRIERSAGRVFAGWEEGRIYFPPTYKYLAGSDVYAVNFANRDKRRTPAWCDRILWRGKGMKQMWYVRGETRFSDHRPVYSLFSVQLAGRVSRPWENKRLGLTPRGMSPAAAALDAKNSAEERLVLHAGRSRSCIETPRF